MLKNLTSLLFCLLFANTLFSQYNIVATGPAFDIPEKGTCDIISQKNGNTAFIQITEDGSVSIRLYDAKHNETAVKKVPLSFGKLRGMEKKGIYEINGDLVVLISEFDDKTPKLYRIIIDGKSGDLKEEKEVGALKKMNAGQAYAVVMGGVPMPAFFAAKDPNSDNYAIALFNTMTDDRNKRIEVVHYNKNHQEISRAYYHSPNDAYKYLSYFDLCVMGDKQVIVSAIGYNTRSSGGDLNGTLLFGSLKSGANTFDLTRINFVGAAELDNGMVRYNPVTNQFIMLSNKRTKASKEGKMYLCYRTIIDAENLTSTTTPINTVKVNAIAMRHYGKKERFGGVPQNIYINADGSFTVVYEEMLTEVVSTGGAITSTGISSSRAIYFRNDIGVVGYDKNGEEIFANYIPKSQQLLRGPGNERENRYKSFYYINGLEKSYVFFNDIAKNQEKIDNKKTVTTIKGTGDCEAFGFTLGREVPMPKRQPVFATSSEDNALAFFVISDYDRQTNTMATLKIDNSRKKGSAQLVWLQPQ